MINKLTISLLLHLASCGARPTEISGNRDTGNQNLQRLRSSRSTEHNSKNHIQNIRTTTVVRLGRGLEQGNHTNVYEGLAVKAEEWEVFMSLSMSTKPAPKPFNRHRVHHRVHYQQDRANRRRLQTRRHGSPRNQLEMLIFIASRSTESMSGSYPIPSMLGSQVDLKEKTFVETENLSS